MTEDLIPHDAPPTGSHRGGIEIKAIGKRMVIPAAYVLAGLSAGITGAGAYVQQRAEAMEDRIGAVEQKTLEHQRALAVNQAILAEVRAQGARIEARVAEIQVTLMRRR